MLFSSDIHRIFISCHFSLPVSATSSFLTARSQRVLLPPMFTERKKKHRKKPKDNCDCPQGHSSKMFTSSGWPCCQQSYTASSRTSVLLSTRSHFHPLLYFLLPSPGSLLPYYYLFHLYNPWKQENRFYKVTFPISSCYSKFVWRFTILVEISFPSDLLGSCFLVS